MSALLLAAAQAARLAGFWLGFFSSECGLLLCGLGLGYLVGLPADGPDIFLISSRGEVRAVAHLPLAIALLRPVGRDRNFQPLRCSVTTASTVTLPRSGPSITASSLWNSSARGFTFAPSSCADAVDDSDCPRSTRYCFLPISTTQRGVGWSWHGLAGAPVARASSRRPPLRPRRRWLASRSIVPWSPSSSALQRLPRSPSSGAAGAAPRAPPCLASGPARRASARALQRSGYRS